MSDKSRRPSKGDKAEKSAPASPLEEAEESQPSEGPTGSDLQSGQSLPAEGNAPTGRRQALRDLRRQLTDADLTSPGVQKLLLDDLERADAECERLGAFVDRFHDVDKRAAVLEEQGRVRVALEVAFGLGTTLGGALIGVAPVVWNSPPAGPIALAIGLVLVIGAAIVRITQK